MIVVFISIAIFVVSFFVDTNILGYHADSLWWTRFTYIYASTNIIHLAVNLYAYTIFNKVLSKLNISHYKHIAFIVAMLATFGSEQALPTIGLSGVVYGMLGITCSRIINKQMIHSLMLVIALNTISFYFGQSNVLLHGLCFLYSFVISFIYGNIKHYLTFKRRIKSL